MKRTPALTTVRKPRAAPSPARAAAPRRLVRRADRRADIVQAALRTFSQRGPDATMAEIARAAGTTESTLFYVFQDRAELVHACVAALLRDPAFATALARAREEPDLRTRLVAACAALRDNMLLVMPLLLAMPAPPDPSLGRGPAWDFQPIESQLVALMQPAAGEPARVWRASLNELVADLIGHLFAGVFRFNAQGQPLPPIERTLDVFLFGALLDPR